ncbi:hypothetical protein [Cytobacillus firmus]|uniref:hypothetical protein n=1 Tax=Cytobacillus firmus TaxID=1399 RepID=UPI001C8E7174|nr:hypothetical protein [Cytobacillus firmus]
MPVPIIAAAPDVTEWAYPGYSFLQTFLQMSLLLQCQRNSVNNVNLIMASVPPSEIGAALLLFYDFE